MKKKEKKIDNFPPSPSKKTEISPQRLEHRTKPAKKEKN